MIQFSVESQKSKEIIDISDLVNSHLKKLGVKEGICHLFVTHTTCALACADLDPGTDQDILEALEKMFPKGRYRHPHDPSHVGEHILSSIIGQSLFIPVQNGKLILGTWQRIILIELSGPRLRNLILHLTN
ncbi:MAG: hypothetical protein A2919_00150 [Candidatus Spechtbacteria bacterium RIFCSPLOWO2_01_FULL_43_12]|uniref:Secondary thiamine-phosphate synthase enzyme n=1 Tax=Candidatus Spechtbacteria bacterium RIFCSPLOWO2_01_FULL_43_12 TaxID=1802162 RepID=A0A1G2HEM6_9BACT|nr:MAG: hypothetical protein A2919_00150 [Candidatus Spechtbacteria bacterium RIFCSPLOWO2_01_FULL_43_12]